MTILQNLNEYGGTSAERALNGFADRCVVFVSWLL